MLYGRNIPVSTKYKIAWAMASGNAEIISNKQAKAKTSWAGVMPGRNSEKYHQYRKGWTGGLRGGS